MPPKGGAPVVHRRHETWMTPIEALEYWVDKGYTRVQAASRVENSRWRRVGGPDKQYLIFCVRVQEVGPNGVVTEIDLDIDE